jgi:uncharacterized protein (TIGR03089 family)
MTPDRLLAQAVVDDPARPLITFYDDSTGERVELSVVTFANWVAKTANLLVDGLGAQPGQRVALDLPVHWQGAVWHAACWAAGLVTVPVAANTIDGMAGMAGTTGVGGAAENADIVVLAMVPDGAVPDGAAAERRLPRTGEVVGLGLGPLGLPRPGIALPAYITLDYDREIHGFGDVFRADVEPERPALLVNGTLHSAAELGAATTAFLQRWSLPPGARILSLLPFDDLLAIVAGLLGPLANGGGTVLCRHADHARLPARTGAENVTAVTGLPEGVLPGLLRLT